MCAVLVLSFSACEINNTANHESPGDYHDGYVDGYMDGYDDGVVEGQQELGSYARGRFDDACGYTYGVEEAMTVLTLYADGESFSEEEVFSAICTLDSFYTDVCDVIHDVEYYYD